MSIKSPFHLIVRFCLGGNIPLLCALLIFAPQFAAAAGQPQHLASPGTIPEGLSASDWTNIQAAYEAQRHAIVPTDYGYRASNWGQQWQTQFDGRGFLTRPDGSGWQWGMELHRFGFVARERAVTSKPEVKAEGQRLTYKWDGNLQEWFVNDQRGLEHGFTVQERPANSTGDTYLEFDLTVRGDLRPQVSADASAVNFINSAGTIMVNYAGLKVVDANGKILPSHFEPSTKAEIKLLVDERGARYPITIDPIAQQAYLKASNTEAEDQFGRSVAVSGNTVVMGAPYEDSSASGINGNQNDNNADAAGAAYVFVRNGTTWTQQAYLKASNSDAGDGFGFSVAISGNTLVVGAYGESSNATGVNGDQSDNSTTYSGAVYVFVRSGTTWSQQAYLKASNTDAGDEFGISVAISGNTVAVGAIEESSNATGVNGDQSDNSASTAGAAYVFVRNGTTWTQQAYLKASNTDQGDDFGVSVAISGDTVVVGSDNEDSNATGVNGNQADNSANTSGAAYVYVRNGTTWTQQAYLKASNTNIDDSFGRSVAISENTVIVGAPFEKSNATGVNGNQSDNSANASGAAYVFVRSGTTWSQQAYFKASNNVAGFLFGACVAISGDTGVVGAYAENSNATGVNGNQTDHSALDAGAAYVFGRNGTTWAQQAYLKASNTDAGDLFGSSVAISGDTVAVGGFGESSNSTGVNGNQTDNSADGSGAAYIFAFPSSLLGNVSSRAFVGTGDNVLIGGTIAKGERPTQVLFRAIGPSLANFGVNGVLQNPQLDVHDGQGNLIAHNDNWQEEPDGTANPTRAAQISATGFAPNDPKEAAIFLTVQPGNYTAIVSGVGGTTGIGLVEAYSFGTPP